MKLTFIAFRMKFAVAMASVIVTFVTAERASVDPTVRGAAVRR